MIHLAVGQSITLRAVGPPDVDHTTWSWPSCLEPQCVSQGNIRLTAVSQGQGLVTATVGGQVAAETVVVVDVSLIPLRLERDPEPSPIPTPEVTPNSFAWWGTPAARAVYTRHDEAVSA